jgi:hypothetical protein
MSTDRQIEANRLNAQSSTGPSTPEGRAAVRLNGLKYGLYAETLVLPGEDPAEFDAMLDRLDAEHQPATPTEEIFVSQIAMASWRRARVQRMEVAFYKNEHKDLIGKDWYRALDPIGRLASIAQRDADRGSKSVLAGFKRYETRMDRSILSATQELRRCRADRRAQAQNNDNKAPAQSRNQNQSAPVDRPKAPPGAKIISIETVERPPAPVIPATEPPPNAPPAVDPAPLTDK